MFHCKLLVYQMYVIYCKYVEAKDLDLGCLSLNVGYINAASPRYKSGLVRSTTNLN